MLRKIIFTACVTMNALFAQKVVVVGGGLAGLTCAYRLHQKGVDVEVYEARKRVGGRVFSAKIGDQVIDLGGQSIHDGGEAPYLLELVKEFGLELKESKIYRGLTFLSGDTFVLEKDFLEGRNFDPETLRQEMEEKSQHCTNMYELLKEFVEEDSPLFEHLCTRLAGYEGGDPKTLSTYYRETLYHMLIGGVSKAHLIEDNQITILTLKEGMSALAEKLAEALENRVHLAMPLTSVAKQGKGYSLTFSNGETCYTDILVLATPCPVYEDIDFAPGVIETEKLEHIKNVAYGTNAKIILPLDSAFDKNVHLINDRSILVHFSSNLRTIYYTRDSSRFTPATIAEHVLPEKELLCRCFGKEVIPLEPPVYAKDALHISYESPVGHSWPNDPYAKGSYSYIAAGQEALLTDTCEVGKETVKTLFAPIDDTLFFAGEHASILFDVPGTMEAACESGARTARMIAKITR